MDFGRYFEGLGFAVGIARGMSPSSVIVIRGFRCFGFERGEADLNTGRSFGDSNFFGERGAVRFKIVPPLPAIHR